MLQTTFIKYLLERDFPGAHIGPEPTTDRFVAVMYGKDERIIPGNALAADASKPFTALNKFGMAFLNKFECSQCDSPILEKISFVDTPGVLSGEKQRIGRAYNFPELIEWFAERADRSATQQHRQHRHILRIDGEKAAVRREADGVKSGAAWRRVQPSLRVSEAALEATAENDAMQAHHARSHALCMDRPLTFTRSVVTLCCAP